MPQLKMKKSEMVAVANTSLYFIASFLWLELVFRAFYVKSFLSLGLLYIVLFSLPVAGVCGVVSSIFSPKVNKIVRIGLMSVVTLWYLIQGVYHDIFGTMFSLSSFSMAGQALGSYWRETLAGILSSSPLILLSCVPVASLIYGAVKKRFFHFETAPRRDVGVVLGVAIVAQLVGVACIGIPTSGIQTTREIYRQSFIPDLTLSNFGVFTTLRLDITRSLIGLEEAEEFIPPTPVVVTPLPSEQDEDETPTKVEVVYAPNVMDIDFVALAAEESESRVRSIHNYVASITPTMQNEYTGIYEGKNLIYITAEAFWTGAVHEELTPTFYKMINEGFVFENFYNPLWYYSTVDGEYAHTTGLIPSNQVNASQRYAGKNGHSMYFALGHQMGALGYPTMAYHNNTATYYDRDITHPNLGYDDYIAGDTGLDVDMVWPQSDLQMMELTIPQALAGELPFHNYYMAVSGHMNYNFGGNQMSKKNQAAVADTDFSTAAQAYIACNIELDKALEYILDQLEQAGELENTVIVMSSDHYPYGLDGTGAIDELTYPGVENDPQEIHRSELIIWCGEMEETIYIDKPCSSIDVLPTVLNLFGIEYDSRLFSGQDILSDREGLVIFNDRSFITPYGRYNTSTNQFTANEGVTLPDEYDVYMYNQVKNIMKYAGEMLFTDYYRAIGLVHE